MISQVVQIVEEKLKMQFPATIFLYINAAIVAPSIVRTVTVENQNALHVALQNGLKSEKSMHDRFF